jgi:hypothetical protein
MVDLEYPLDAIKIIGNIYTNSTTRYIGEYFDKIEPIYIQRGILSPNLESLLRWLQRDQKGYIFKTSNSHKSAATYADDLATITNNITII